MVANRVMVPLLCSQRLPALAIMSCAQGLCRDANPVPELKLSSLLLCFS